MSAEPHVELDLDLREVARLSGNCAPDGPVGSLVFSPNAEWLAVGVRDQVHIFDRMGAVHRSVTYVRPKAAKGERLQEVASRRARDDVTHLEFSSDGQWLAVAAVRYFNNSDGHFGLNLFQVETGRCVGGVNAIGPDEYAFSPGARWFAAIAGFGSTTRALLWDLADGANQSTLDEDVLSGFLAGSGLAFRDDAALAIAQGRTLRLVRIPEGRLDRSAELDEGSYLGGPYLFSTTGVLRCFGRESDPEDWLGRAVFWEISPDLTMRSAVQRIPEEHRLTKFAVGATTEDRVLLHDNKVAFWADLKTGKWTPARIAEAVAAALGGPLESASWHALAAKQTREGWRLAWGNEMRVIVVSLVE